MENVNDNEVNFVHVEPLDNNVQAVEATTPVVEKPKVPELNAEQKADLQKKRQYMTYIKAGGEFLNFVIKDIDKQVREEMNRAQRRRFQKDLRKGVISEEIFRTYLARVDEVIIYMDNALGIQTVKVENVPVVAQESQEV